MAVIRRWSFPLLIGVVIGTHVASGDWKFILQTAEGVASGLAVVVILNQLEWRWKRWRWREKARPPRAVRKGDWHV